MTDTKNHISATPGSLEGRIFKPATDQETAEAVDLALDYRGDITLELASGESLVGYLFNRDFRCQEPWIEIFPAEKSSPRKIPYGLIVSIAFTGEDTANGKSWEAWVSKKESERLVEAQRVEEDARSRGLL